jgi:uncharacterized protein YndB with AHSA1/START domain
MVSSIQVAAVLLAATLAADSTPPKGASVNHSRSVVAPVTDRVIHVSALLAVPPARAYEYFTRVDLLVGWLTAAAEVEPRVDGKYELFWEPADRENNSTIGCRITAMQADQFIAFQWRSPEQFKTFANGADPLTHVTVMFVPEGSGTRIHLVHTGWRSSSGWEEARTWQEQAWSGAIKELEQIATP